MEALYLFLAEGGGRDGAAYDTDEGEDGHEVREGEEQ
jgi:hypothetical protein